MSNYATCTLAFLLLLLTLDEFEMAIAFGQLPAYIPAELLGHLVCTMLAGLELTYR